MGNLEKKDINDIIKRIEAFRDGYQSPEAAEEPFWNEVLAALDDLLLWRDEHE